MATAESRPLEIATEEELVDPVWSVDGRKLLFTGVSPAGAQVLRVDEAGGTPEPLTDYGWAEPIDTPQGVLVRSTTRPGIWRLSAGRSPEQVFTEPDFPVLPQHQGYSSRPWTIENGRLYALSHSDGGRSLLSRAISGGPVSRIRFEGECKGMLTVNPRTHEIACTAVEYQHDIGVIRFRRR